MFEYMYMHDMPLVEIWCTADALLGMIGAPAGFPGICPFDNAWTYAGALASATFSAGFMCLLDYTMCRLGLNWLGAMCDHMIELRRITIH